MTELEKAGAMLLTQSLHRMLQQSPDAPLTVCGDRVRTVRESADRIARLAGALRDLGTEPGDRVAMLAHNSDRYHEYLFATWWIGAAVVPLNIRWSTQEIGYSLRDCGADVLFVDDAFADHVTRLEAPPATVVHCGDAPTPAGMLAYEDLIENAGAACETGDRGEDLAGIFYTGGTSGTPKGVMLSHTNMALSALGSQVSGRLAAPGGRTLHSAPMFHLADLAMWNAQNLVGGTHVILPGFEPGAVLAAIQTHRTTSALLVPTMIQALVDHPSLPEHDLSSMRSIVYGASPMPEAVLKRAMDAFPGVAFVQAYGMTEAAPIATLLTGADHVAGRRLRSAGRAAAHSEVKIVDLTGREVARGTVGEIALRGGHIMRGYWGRPEESAAVLREGWLHTGDGAYMDDEGYVFVVDRLKDMIISGGENIYSAEVENAIAQHPAVAACAVIGVPDVDWGERVHAVIVLRAGHTTTAEHIRQHTKTLIAGYKAPRSVEFTDALPLSPAGKILKRELRAPHWEQSDRSVH
ncbi:long-chain fatty acid--CoA ligase [Streptomyces sp. NPDC056486]|uniref:acyl-CoA synthetase n=1 Tax=Streptomyces sp. NPDC056486 TaxID=3345835 RepID=UPI0036927727